MFGVVMVRDGLMIRFRHVMISRNPLNRVRVRVTVRVRVKVGVRPLLACLAIAVTLALTLARPPALPHSAQMNGTSKRMLRTCH